MKIYNLTLILFLFCPFAFSVKETRQPSLKNTPVAANLVFKSMDGGQSWQDVSEGLPVNWQGEHFFASERGLYINDGKEVFYSSTTATAPFWKKELPTCSQVSIVPFKTGTFQYNYNGQFLQTISGKSVWSPMYMNFKQRVNTIFETEGGTVFIGSDHGLFKSTNKGTSWKQVYNGGWVMKLVASGDVLLATSHGGILRSTDGGENWDWAISEGGVGIAVERIRDGFAAITFNKSSETRRVRTSYDAGKTWQAIDAGLKADLSITSIIEVGDYFFCGHPSGIFRSPDKGKTWKLLLPSVGDKVFNLYASGNVIYAVPQPAGC